MAPLRFVVIGLGGYGLAHLSAVEWLEKLGLGKLTGVVALEIDRQRNPQLVAQLTDRRIPLFDNIEHFLGTSADSAEVLTVPIGIHMHVPVSIAAMEHGLEVYCEKPLAATVQDVDRLIAARNRTGRTVTVGFQHLFAETMQALKKRIVDGRLGRVKSASLASGWPRSFEYYSRNDWTGRLRKGEHWVLDSPAHNAMGHYLMNLLYLCADKPHAAAIPERVTAELYRAYPNEGPDIVQIQLVTDTAAEAHIILTHTSDVEFGPEMRLECENGTVVWHSHDGIAAVTYRDGRREQIENTQEQWRFEGFRNLVQTIRHEAENICPPEVARSLTLTINATHESCPEILDVPAINVIEEEDWEIYPPNTRGHFRRVRDLASASQQAIAKKAFFSEMEIPWAKPGTAFDARDYAFFPKTGGAFAGVTSYNLPSRHDSP